MKSIENAVVFVAGGSSGIGLGLAKEFCTLGARVAITYRREDHRDEAIAQCRAVGCDILALPMDVTDRAAFERAAQEVEQVLGPADIFCNSAGVSLFGPMENATYDDWDWVFNVNVGGVINGLMTIVPRMIRRGTGGHIITVGSMAGFLPGPEAGIYSASKFAVRGIMECLRLNLAKHGISVSLVSPGLVNSNIHEAALGRPPSLAASGMLSGEISIAMTKYVLSRGAAPGEIGKAIVNGIRRNEFYIFTHPDFTLELREVYEEIVAAQPIGEIPKARQKIEDERRRHRREALAMAAAIAGWDAPPPEGMLGDSGPR
jgi:NAD(P)-dependent dehydrogenase (short-subunit alcohol dehydrogenase family)